MKLKTKIAIADNHSLLRHAVSKFINELSDRFTVSIECPNGFELVKALKGCAPRELPRIVLTDLVMPVMDGFETTRLLRKHYPDIKILVLTMGSDEATIIRLIKAGISGYLVKNIDVEELFDALATVADGGTYFKTFDASLILPSEEKNPVEDIWDELSEIERQFVKLCASDLEDKEILAKVGIRPNTTEPFARKIYARFGVKTRVGLVMLVTKHRLFPLEDL